MAKLNATITAKQLAGWTSELERYNAEQTAEYAKRVPPEVFTPLDIDGLASLRCGQIGDSYADQTTGAKLKEIERAYREGNQAKRDAIENALK